MSKRSKKKPKDGVIAGLLDTGVVDSEQGARLFGADCVEDALDVMFVGLGTAGSEIAKNVAQFLTQADSSQPIIAIDTEDAGLEGHPDEIKTLRIGEQTTMGPIKSFEAGMQLFASSKQVLTEFMSLTLKEWRRPVAAAFVITGIGGTCAGGTETVVEVFESLNILPIPVFVLPDPIEPASVITNAARVLSWMCFAEEKRRLPSLIVDPHLFLDEKSPSDYASALDSMNTGVAATLVDIVQASRWSETINQHDFGSFMGGFTGRVGVGTLVSCVFPKGIDEVGRMLLSGSSRMLALGVSIEDALTGFVAVQVPKSQLTVAAYNDLLSTFRNTDVTVAVTESDEAEDDDDSGIALLRGVLLGFPPTDKIRAYLEIGKSLHMNLPIDEEAMVQVQKAGRFLREKYSSLVVQEE